MATQRNSVPHPTTTPRESPSLRAAADQTRAARLLSGALQVTYWLYLNHEDGTARISVEGWILDDIIVELAGNDHDVALIANTFASILDRL